MKVIETHSNTEYELLVRGRGRLVLKGAGKEVVVLGCGSSRSTALHDLNESSVSKTNNLHFIGVN